MEIRDLKIGPPNLQHCIAVFTFSPFLYHPTYNTQPPNLQYCIAVFTFSPFLYWVTRNAYDTNLSFFAVQKVRKVLEHIS